MSEVWLRITGEVKTVSWTGALVEAPIGVAGNQRVKAGSSREQVGEVEGVIGRRCNITAIELPLEGDRRRTIG